MSPALQTLVAAALVAAAGAWLFARARSRRNNPGCGGGCACPGSELRVRFKTPDRSH